MCVLTLHLLRTDLKIFVWWMIHVSIISSFKITQIKTAQWQLQTWCTLFPDWLHKRHNRKSHVELDHWLVEYWIQKCLKMNVNKIVKILMPKTEKLVYLILQEDRIFKMIESLLSTWYENNISEIYFLFLNIIVQY